MSAEAIRTLSDVFDNIVNQAATDEDVIKYNKLKVKPETKFPTGSEYKGEWNALGMEGQGEFVMFHNVSYKGQMHDGMFHGLGCLKFPNGARMEGIWEKGHMISHTYFFAGGMCYDETYCRMPDRRFLIERQEGLEPAGKTYGTNDPVPRPIPEDCYDVVDGFYNPKTRCVTDATDNKKILRIPTQSEHEWIIKNCRKAWDEPAGYRPDLFENWKQESEKSYSCSSSTLSDIEIQTEM